MGGIIGTLLMLIEASKCGAILNIDNLIYPSHVDLETWLLCFPSYGFLLSVTPNNLNAVQNEFNKKNICCHLVGKITTGSQLILESEKQCYVFWNLTKEKFILT